MIADSGNPVVQCRQKSDRGAEEEMYAGADKGENHPGVLRAGKG